MIHSRSRNFTNSLRRIWNQWIFFRLKKKTRSFRTTKIFESIGKIIFLVRSGCANTRSAISIKKLFRVPRLSSGCSLYIVGKLGSGDRSNRSGSYLVVVFRCYTGCLPADRVGARATTRKQQRGMGDGRGGSFRTGSIRIIRYSNVRLNITFQLQYYHRPFQ